MTGCGTECLTIAPSIYIERKEYLCINIGNSMADWDEDMDKITPNGQMSYNDQLTIPDTFPVKLGELEPSDTMYNCIPIMVIMMMMMTFFYYYYFLVKNIGRQVFAGSQGTYLTQCLIASFPLLYNRYL